MTRADARSPVQRPNGKVVFRLQMGGELDALVHRQQRGRRESMRILK